MKCAVGALSMLAINLVLFYFSGIKFLSVDDAMNCAKKGCTVWTEQELAKLADHHFTKGFWQGAFAVYMSEDKL